MKQRKWFRRLISTALALSLTAGLSVPAAADQGRVGTSEVALTILDPDTGERVVRRGETNLGDFCTDAYRMVLGTDVALVNGGAIRADLGPGEITYEALKKVQPFGGTIHVAEVTGQDILDALEMGARLYPEENPGFLQVSGLTYTVNTALPSTVIVDAEGDFLKVSGTYRVTNVEIGGDPLDVDTVYTLAASDYILSGGDGYSMLLDAQLLPETVDDVGALASYLSEVLNGTVGEEYADPCGQGRITVLKETEDRSDVVPDPVLRALINQTLSTPEHPRNDGDPISAGDMALLTGSDAETIDAAEDGEVFALKGLCSDNLEYQNDASVDVNLSHGIESLEGLQYAVNLKSLDLSENDISDLSPLAGLENLTYLELDRNYISDLTPLGGLTGLVHLNLYNNEITDITPLAPLKILTWFDLHYANRGKAHLPIGTLADLTALEYISIESNCLVNEDLDALAGLEHLNYIKLNANYITDLTPIASHLEGIMAGESCRIEVNNQSLPNWERALVEAPPEGGEVTLALPEVTGIDALFTPSELPLFPGASATMAQEVSGVSVDFATDEEWNPITNQAVFSFDGRTYGASLDESGQLCLSFLIEGMDMTTFETITPFVYTLYLPVELKQDALYQADLTWEGEGAFVTIDTAAGESASQTLTGSLTTASGEPVDLSEIRSIQFYAGEKAYESKIEGLEARNITVEGNTFTFQAALSEGSAFSGARCITPVVEYIRTGSETVETTPRDTLIFYLFAGDASAFRVDSTITFDLARTDGGNVTSEPVTLSIPGEDIGFVDLWDAFDTLLVTGERQEDGTYRFTLPVEQVPRIDIFYLSAREFLYPKVQTQVVWSGPVSDLAAEGLTAGEQTAPTITWAGTPVTLTGEETFTSSDPSVLKVEEDGTLTALRAGNATLTVEGLQLPMTVEGVTFPAVTVRKAEIPVAVSPAPDSGSGSGGGSGSGVTRYAITASAGEGGSISPSGTVRVAQGAGRTFTITPEAGNVIGDVRVDGRSVGAVESYTFENVRGNHTIEALFEAELPAVDVPLGGALPFADVSEDAWYYEAVAYCYENGLMAGTGETSFQPDMTTTRGMIVTLLYRLEGEPGLEAENPGDSFTDVEAGAYYGAAVRWARRQGIASGYDAERFGPNDPISREQMAAILYRYARYKGYDVTAAGDLSGFADAASVSAWALPAVRWANGAGLLQGTSAGTLNPMGTASRAEAAALLARFCENNIRE